MTTYRTNDGELVSGTPSEVLETLWRKSHVHSESLAAYKHDVANRVFETTGRLLRPDADEGEFVQGLLALGLLEIIGD